MLCSFIQIQGSFQSYCTRRKWEEYNETLEEALSQMAGKKVHIRKRGIQGLISLAQKNAELQTEQYLLKVGERKDVSARLAELIGQKKYHA